MIKTIVFDIGNVVWSIHPLSHTTFHSWASLAGLKYRDFYQKYLEVYRDIEIGVRDLKDLADSLGVDVHRLQSTLDRSLSDFETYLIPETVDFIALLRSHGFKVGCLSNTESFMSPYLYRHILPLFDYSILSFEVGCRKPDPQIFHHINRHISCSPHEIIFIDDKLANVRGARACGLYAIRFRDPLKVYDRVLRILRETG